MDSSIEELFWLTVQPRLHHLHDLFIGVELLASHVLFKWSKQYKVTWGQIWTGLNGAWGSISHCSLSRTPLVVCTEFGWVLLWRTVTLLDSHPCLLVLMAGKSCRWEENSSRLHLLVFSLMKNQHKRGLSSLLWGHTTCGMISTHSRPTLSDWYCDSLEECDTSPKI